MIKELNQKEVGVVSGGLRGLGLGLDFLALGVGFAATGVASFVATWYNGGCEKGEPSKLKECYVVNTFTFPVICGAVAPVLLAIMKLKKNAVVKAKAE
ncbi:MAG: hypothetical protein KKE11_00910 [Gammaproteobacteria bacterium]|nr:hypothetical protein [Gammaproteobacteria bacterium]